MALGFLRKTEQEKHFPSNASSISPRHPVPKVDDKFIDSSMYSKIFGHARTVSQEEASSTESGDDFSSVRSISPSITSKDSEAGDDEKTLSPRSDGIIDVSSVYSVMCLLQLRVACCARAQQRSILGYGTESVPQSDSSGSSPIHSPKKAPTQAPKSRRPPKQSPKKASKVRTAAPSFARLPSPALPASADSWIANQRARVSSDDDDAKVIRAARSILNKLTIEKFDSLFRQLVVCGIRTPHHITMLMSEVFEKATAQHQFIPMYADLCVRLERDPRIASAAMRAGPLHNFRRLLLNQCQNVFEQLLEPDAAESVVDEEDQIRRKQQALGNIKLIGELLVRGMLSSGLFVECAKALLENRKTCPEALECLAALMMVAGPIFDTKDWQHSSTLDAIFSDMDELTKDKSTPPRLRFLLRDVLDVRGAGWCASVNQAAVKAAPMKLEEVREKQAAEQAATSPKRQSKNNQGKARVTEPLRRPVASEGNNKPFTCPMDEFTTQADGEFDLVTFRRALATVLAKLATEKDVPAAVQCIRLQQVPVEYQADQYVDILTRIVEERRGAVRRCGFAFAAGLLAAKHSPFDRRACIDGIRLFFNDVYTELCTEVKRLPMILQSEFVPAMQSVFPPSELNEILPEEMRPCPW